MKPDEYMRRIQNLRRDLSKTSKAQRKRRSKLARKLARFVFDHQAAAQAEWLPGQA